MAAPETLYKFRTWNDKFHRKCLTQCEFYASQPSSQNDPLDCKLRFDKSKLDTEAKVEKFYSQHFYFPSFPNPYDFAKQVRAFKIEFNKNPDAIFEKFNKHIFNLDDRIQGVFSLCKVWDATLLWTYYADGYKGFCVGLKTERLVKSMQVFMHKDVVYEENLPLIDPNLNILQSIQIRLFTKKKEYEHEQEYRFFKTWIWPDEFRKPIERTIFLRPDVISEITLGLNINPLHEKIIASICKKNKWPLYKTFFAEDQNKLDRKLIN